jgi:drug/metabolite transporter (DMT)-like permease
VRILSSEEKGYLMAASSAAVLSTTVLMSKFMFALGTGPTVVAAYRAVAAAALLAVGLAVGNSRLLKVEGKGLLSLAAMGLVMGLSNALYFNALQRTAAAVAVMLLYTYPGFLTLFERLVEHRPIGQNKTTALILTFSGCLVLTGVYQPSILVSNLPGTLLGIGAAACLALYAILGKRLTHRHDPLTVNLYSFVFGGAFLFMVSPPQAFLSAHLGPREWGAVLYLALGPMILGYWLFFKALRHLEASRVGITGMLEPVLGAVWGWVFFNEALTLSQGLGGTMALLGVGALRLLPEAKHREAAGTTQETRARSSR